MHVPASLVHSPIVNTVILSENITVHHSLAAHAVVSIVAPGVAR